MKSAGNKVLRWGFHKWDITAGGCATLTHPTSNVRPNIVGRVSAAHPPRPVFAVGFKGNMQGRWHRSVRHHAAFICVSSSRERAKGAHRRPLCNPGSRQKIAPAGKPCLFPSGHGSGKTIRPCIVMPSHRLLGPSLGLAPSGPTLRVVQKCSRHFCPSGAPRPAAKRRGRFFLAGAKPSAPTFP